MSYLACFRTDEGTNLFTRNLNNFKVFNQLPLDLETTLNTLFAFGVKHNAKVHSSDSINYKIVWKMYPSNITLILIEELVPIDEHVYFDKIDLLYDGMIFMYGIEDITSMNNSEKFKKEIKICFPILDSILEYKFDLFSGYLTGCFDTFITEDIGILQNKLNESLDKISTFYGALFLNGKIVVASTAWWKLNPNESHLISLLCLTSSNANSRDIPIYLPYKNPNQALRLLTYNLTSDNLVICFICSEKPSVDFVETNLISIWYPIYQLLVNLKQYIPRNLPNSISVDKNMIAFLLINKRLKCCYSSLFPNEQSTSYSSKLAKQRVELLKDCYLNISTNFFRKYFKSSLNIGENEYEETTLTFSPEAYTLIKNVKCYALNEPLFEFYALYNSTIPTYAIRGVTKAHYNAFISKLTIT